MQITPVLNDALTTHRVETLKRQMSENQVNQGSVWRYAEWHYPEKISITTQIIYSNGTKRQKTFRVNKVATLFYFPLLKDMDFSEIQLDMHTFMILLSHSKGTDVPELELFTRKEKKHLYRLAKAAGYIKIESLPYPYSPYEWKYQDCYKDCISERDLAWRVAMGMGLTKKEKLARIFSFVDAILNDDTWFTPHNRRIIHTFELISPFSFLIALFKKIDTCTEDLLFGMITSRDSNEMSFLYMMKHSFYTCMQEHFPLLFKLESRIINLRIQNAKNDPQIISKEKKRMQNMFARYAKVIEYQPAQSAS